MCELEWSHVLGRGDGSKLTSRILVLHKHSLLGCKTFKMLEIMLLKFQSPVSFGVGSNPPKIGVGSNCIKKVPLMERLPWHINIVTHP